MDNTALHQALVKFKSQQALATAIGVSQPAIFKALRRVNDGKPLSPQLAIKISDLMGIPRYEIRPDLWPAPLEAAQ